VNISSKARLDLLDDGAKELIKKIDETLSAKNQPLFFLQRVRVFKR